ncbi:hypothetical protein evm_000638 [Chilo suppressalis]|nr:hypothetical protein evm_000638 [Chilo suppressalis]
MPKCCVVMCSARKNKNQPQLTLHRFPKNEALKEKWLEAIGKRNINPRQKISVSEKVNIEVAKCKKVKTE